VNHTKQCRLLSLLFYFLPQVKETAPTDGKKERELANTKLDAAFEQALLNVCIARM